MIGKTVSHYKIIEKLGEGGMGIVYKAQDTNLDRFVALKFLPQHLTSSEEEKQRFIHEAKAASSLDHTNICNIYEIDETEDGQLFISMAYYEGESLEAKIKDERLKIKESLDYTIQIANGLNKAHQKGITHRDIKPTNIIVTDDNVIKILDFGLAKLAGQTKLTKEGTTLGTVAYMSPEQTRGETVDHRSDIWSLGVIIYEMISGQLPFKGDYDQAVMYGITNEDPEPLSGLRTGVPLELERIVNRMLTKDPQDRYQHADDLLSELNRLKKESDSETTPQIKPEIPKKKSKSVAIPAIILSIVVLIIAGYLWLKPSQPEPTDLPGSEWENSIAILQFDDLSPERDQEWLCEGMTDQIISNLAKLPQLKVISRTSVMKYKETNKTIPEIGKELNVAYVLEGSLQKIGDRIRVIAQLISTDDDFHLWSEHFDKEYRDLFNVQDEVSEAIASNLLKKLSNEEIGEVKTIRPKNTEAWEYYQKGVHFHLYKFVTSYSINDFNKAEKMFKMAIELDPSYAPSHAELANLYNTYYNLSNRFKLSKKEKEKYLKLQEEYINKAIELDPNSASVQEVKGWVHSAKNELDKAYECYRKSILLEPNNSFSICSLAKFYRDRGLYDLAINYFTKTLELDPLYLDVYTNRSINYYRLGDYELAELGIKKALEIDKNFGDALYWYSRLSFEIKNYDQAKIMMDKYKELYPDRSGNKFLKSLLYLMKGEKEKALELYPKGYLLIYIYLGMVEETIESLNKNYKLRIEDESSWYLWLKNSPIFNFLRSDPRFQEIIAKHKELYEEILKKYGDIEL